MNKSMLKYPVASILIICLSSLLGCSSPSTNDSTNLAGDGSDTTGTDTGGAGTTDSNTDESSSGPVAGTIDNGGSSTNYSCTNLQERDYDIVYVRYPAEDGGDRFVTIPQGEHAYDIAPGGDLVLLKADGTEDTLVDCDTCSVMDPYISYDGNTVYYSLNENANSETPSSWIYKINLKDPSYTPIRMTFNNGFESMLYAGNTATDDDFASHNKIRDMAPIPLADGRILFTSNRKAFTPFKPGTNAIKSSVSQLYVMDDHDGTAITPELANMKIFEFGNLHLVQHPIQLMDGRILFSSWQDVATRFHYAMTNLMTVNPDGSNLQQFTEPHQHQKFVDHFATQLSSGDIASGLYYPSFDYGYGVIARYPINPEGNDFQRDRVNFQKTAENSSDIRISDREFDRKGTVNLTWHTTSADQPAPNKSGKYAMPAALPGGHLMVAYSTGYVNHFNAACKPDACDALKSGIYIMPNAACDGYIKNPALDLVKIKDDPSYNEIWPRPVLSYQAIYGQDKPDTVVNSVADAPQDDRLKVGEATALVGTSSMYNREPPKGNDPDPFQSHKNRERHDGNWTIVGTEAGVFSDAEIYGVRLITSPSTPFTSPINGKDEFIKRHSGDSRLKKVPARFGSYHGERWEILGEFPLANKDVTDVQGNPDSSWLAKIPADTPMFIQTIDEKGMTLTSELTWRALKSGEIRADCGGCHAHSDSAPHVNFFSTQTGKRAPIKDIPGLSDNDEHIQNGFWDLTKGDIPLLTSEGVSFQPGNSVGVEFYRDVVPILNTRCVSCHTATGTGNSLILDGTNADDDAWAVLSDRGTPSGGKYIRPQRSKYIREPQARQSLLNWVVWGERLDGRQNDTRDNDIDYTPEIHDAHIQVVANLTDTEKRTISRWIDLGGPVDLPQPDGFGYTEDPVLPIVNIQFPRAGDSSGNNLVIGFADAHSGLDFSTLSIMYYSLSDPAITNLITEEALIDIDTTLNNLQAAIASIEKSIAFNINSDLDVGSKVLTIALPGSMSVSTEYVIVVTIKDNAGNIGKSAVRFTKG